MRKPISNRQLLFGFILILASMIGAMSCSDTPSDHALVLLENSKRLDDIAREKIAAATRFDQVFEKVREIELEASDESIFGTASHLVLTDDRIYVLDQHLSRKVFVFMESGSFLRVLGTTGKGPGEYDSPVFLGVDSDENAVVLNERPYKLIWFDREGQFLRELNLQNKEIIANKFLINNNRLYFYTIHPQFTRLSKGKKVLVTDFNGKVLGQMGTSEKELEQFLLQRGAMQIDPLGNIWLGRIFDLGIEIYSAEGTLLKTVTSHIDHLPSPIMPDVLANLSSEEGATALIRRMRERTMIGDIYFVADKLAVLATAGLGRVNLTLLDLRGEIVKEKFVFEPATMESQGIEGAPVASQNGYLYCVKILDEPGSGSLRNARVLVYTLRE